MEKLIKFTKSSTKTDEVSFQKLMAAQAFQMSVNYKGTLEHVMDVCEVCASCSLMSSQQHVFVCHLKSEATRIRSQSITAD